VAPQFATYVLETIYGDMATLGNAAAQLRTHIGGACSAALREELVEIMMQLVPYVGVAAAINGVAACREVFAGLDNK
jgi:4-carboxymuconolactone decarboxylase